MDTEIKSSRQQWQTIRGTMCRQNPNRSSVIVFVAFFTWQVMMNLHLHTEAVKSDEAHYVLTSNEKVTRVLPILLYFFISSCFVEPSLHFTRCYESNIQDVICILFSVSHPPTAALFKTHSQITGNMEQAFKLDSSSFKGNKTQGWYLPVKKWWLLSTKEKCKVGCQFSINELDWSNNDTFQVYQYARAVNVWSSAAPEKSCLHISS